MENISENLKKIYMISEDVVARKIEDDIIIVPIIAGIGSMDDDIYTLNDTGQSVWELMDGKRSLKEIATTLEEKYDAPFEHICKELLELIATLLKHRIIVEKTI
eukprot:Anaeramoba_ignava/a482935_15.p3 GENE.a482935_15~~a482935_15.p3  ORF type:complete len:104 (-),score=17.68 a482935_15:695-1006(-)